MQQPHLAQQQPHGAHGYYQHQQPNMMHQKSMNLPVYMQPLSRQSHTNSHAMTVKEHESHNKRSLSLCSISEHISGGLGNDQNTDNNNANNNNAEVRRHNEQL